MGYLRATTFQKENQQEKTSNDQFYSFSNDYSFINVKFNYDLNYFIKHCFILPIESCPIDPTQIEIFYRQVNNDRRANNFETFVGSTNEKQQTSDITSTLLENYIFKVNEFLQSISVVDLGVGQGTLSSKVATSLKGQCNELSYDGIDREAKFIDKNRKIFLTLEIKESKFIVGDCFGGDVDQLVDHPTILIASQVVFYAPDVGNFIDLIVRKMGAVAFVIGQTNPSFLNKMSKQYAGTHKQKDVESKVEKSLINHSEKILSSNILYSSYIDFPKIKDLEEIAYDCYDCITDPNKRKARELMESMCGTPLEYIEYKNKLDSYMGDLQAHLAKMNGQGIFWNFMQVIIPNEGDNNQKLQDAVKVIYSQKFSGNLIEPNKAIIEGNVEALRDILKSGMIIPEISDPKSITLFEKFLLSTRLYPILLFFREDTKFTSDRKEHITRALEGYDRDISELLWDNVEDNTYETNIKIIYHEIEKIASYTSQEALKSTAAYPFLLRGIADIFRLVFVSVRANDIFMKFDLYRHQLLVISCFYMNLYTIYMHSNTDFVVAHSLAIDGRTRIFTKFLPYIKNSLNTQSGTGKTALHYALENNNTEIAKLILSCNETRIDIRDNKGYLALHYAANTGNIKIIKYFIENREINLNEETYTTLLHFVYNTQAQSSITFFVCSFLPKIGNYYNDMFLFQIFDRIYKHILAGFIIRNILLWKITTPEATLLPSYATEELSNMLPSDLKKDSLLHLAIRNNHSETALWLLEKGVSLTSNLDGMSPVHLAAANNNINLIKVILQKNITQLSKLAYLRESYLSYTAKAVVSASLVAMPILATNPIINNNHQYSHARDTGVYLINLLWSLYSLYNKKSNLYGKKYGNVLHFAASGIVDINNIAQNYFNKTYHDSRNLTKEQDMQKLATLEFLVKNELDVDYGLKFGFSSLNPILLGAGLPYSLSWFIHFSNIFDKLYGFITWSIILIEVLYYENIRPIDLVEKYVYDPDTNTTSISSSYEFLKQYTSVDFIREMTYMEYLPYCLGLHSKNDLISIKEYGTYSGGDGNDTFILTRNFEGKERDLKIIIKDYQEKDKIILDVSFGIFDISDIKYVTHQLLNENATTLYTKDDQAIVTLLNYDCVKIKVETVYSEKYIFAKSWWQYFLQNKKIELNSYNTIYQSDNTDTVFIITTTAIGLVYKINNFDCVSKSQKLDFRGFENIKNIFDLELIEHDDKGAVIVANRNTEAPYVELYGITLEQLSRECFILGKDFGDIKSEL